MGKQKRKERAERKRILNAEKAGLDNAYTEMGAFAPSVVQNGLSDALGLGGVQGIGAQISQADTLFKNNRWYLVSNLRQLLSQIYVELGLVQTVVDVPVEDALRGGIEIKSSQLSEEEITKLTARMVQQDDLQTVGQAMKWNRLFGGSAVVIMTGQDPKSELNWETITEDSPLEFRAVDMWELYYAKQNTDDYSSAMNGDQMTNAEYFDYYGIQIHKSRVLLMKGIEAPSFVRPKLRGWGVSVVETLVRSINQYLKATDLTFEVLDEFKIDIFKIKGLTASLHSKDGTEAIRRRVALTAEQKNYQNAITMDGEDDYVQKQLSFAGISETMTGIRMQVASDLRMPMTKIFGISSAGFSSGEDDIENYNATVESGTRVKGRPVILTVMKIRCQQMFGHVPDDLSFDYKPLRVLSSEQEENVKTQRYNRALQARQAGELTKLEFREIVNRENLLGMKLDTKGLDDSLDELNKPEAIPVPSQGQYQRQPKSATDTPVAPVAKNSIDQDAYNFKGKRVAVVGIRSGNELLCGLRRDDKKWVCPAGHIEEGEHPKDGALREVFEESGIRLLPNDLKEIGAEITVGHDGKPLALFSYMATINKQEASSENDPDNEVSEWRWVEIAKDSEELRFDNRHAGHNDAIINYMQKEIQGCKKKRRKLLPSFGMKK